MKFEFYVGIDPGISGGIAVLTWSGLVQEAAKMPEDFTAFVDILKPFTRYRCIAAIERVSSSPQMGVVSAFTFGKSYGAALIVPVALDMAIKLVEPKAWQHTMGVVYPKSRPRNKNISKARAEKFFPGITVTHAIADALLIAAYCRRCHEG